MYIDNARVITHFTRVLGALAVAGTHPAVLLVVDGLVHGLG